MTIKKFFIASLAFLLAGCSAPHRALPEKAIVGVTAIEEAIQIQKEIDKHSHKHPPTGKSWFEVIEGSTPIIVTAPHATRPFLNGRYRFADGGGTAALAKMLNKLAGVTVIYTTYESPSDPNFYDDNEFKVALAGLIEKLHPRLVLDIHASNSYRPYDVDLGTMNGKSLRGNEALATDLIEILRAEGLGNISYNFFAASKNQTITKFATTHGVPAIQLEINKTWLVPAQDNLAAHRFAQLLQAMVKYIEGEKENISGKR